MREKPDITDERILQCLKGDFALAIVAIEFLPVGADVHSAAYRAVADDGAAYFVKLRRNAFREPSVTLPKYLHDLGLATIITPLATQSDSLWATLTEGVIAVYPFVTGSDGYSVEFTEQHWIEMGMALALLHGCRLPDHMTAQIPRETYSSRWRDDVLAWLQLAQGAVPADPLSAELTALLNEKCSEISALVSRTAALAITIQRHPPVHVVCHSDLHAGNVLIDAGGRLFIVDWDDPVWAPKERDLMFVGGGQGFRGRSPAEEVRCFLQGYGAADIDLDVLAYYRCERIVQDIASFCAQIYGTEGRNEDRRQSFQYLKANFDPGGVLAFAKATGKDEPWHQGGVSR